MRTINVGTQAEREVLANMIERGLLTTKLEHNTDVCSELFSESNYHPNSEEPITIMESLFFGSYHFRLNIVGLAILGLQNTEPEIIKAYVEQSRRAGVVKVPSNNRAYHAAADMLGLPFELLWEAAFQAHFGLLIPGTIEELRVNV